jgi:hypothetical protein
LRRVVPAPLGVVWSHHALSRAMWRERNNKKLKPRVGVKQVSRCAIARGYEQKTRARLGGLETPRSHESSLALWIGAAGYRSENSWLTFCVIPATNTRYPLKYAYSASARGAASLGASPECYSPHRHVAHLRIRIAILFEAIHILFALTLMAVASIRVL